MRPELGDPSPSSLIKKASTDVRYIWNRRTPPGMRSVAIAYTLKAVMDYQANACKKNIWKGSE
jgi:hypothetical protein